MQRLILTLLPIVLMLGCATQADLDALEIENKIRATKTDDLPALQTQVDQLVTQVEALHGRIKMLEQRPTYLEEVMTLSDLTEKGCAKGAQTYQTLMADRSMKTIETRHGDLCSALRSDVVDGQSQCHGAATACELTLCEDLGSKVSHLGCSALLNEPWSGYRSFRPPALVAG